MVEIALTYKSFFAILNTKIVNKGGIKIMIFEIRQYDKILLTFEFIEQKLEGQACKILSIDEQYRSLLPLGMKATDDGLLSWLKGRIVPKNREFVHQILSRYGLDQNDTMGIIKLCKGLSLNDSYWVVEQGFEGEFAKYNLYENSFARALALIAYTGYGTSTAKGFSSSPEFTTNGMLRKCWRRLNKKIYLYKLLRTYILTIPRFYSKIIVIPKNRSILWNVRKN